MPAASAFRIAVVQDYDALCAAAAQVTRGTVAHALLSSSIAQSEADVVGAIRTLERAVADASGTDLDWLIELLGPLYASAEQPERLEELLQLPLSTPSLELSRQTLYHVLEHRRNRAATAGTLGDRVASVEDDLLRARWQQRLAVVAYYSEDFDAATELLSSAVQGYAKVGSGRGLAASYSLLYAIQYVATGDIERAFQYARLQEKYAKECGNESLEVAAIVAQYELSAELGDEETFEALRRRIRSRVLPEQYRERFAKSIADMLYLAWRFEFDALRNGVSILQNAPGRPIEERDLCLALQSLAETALGDIPAARRSARRALADIPKAQSGVFASTHRRRYLNLARSLAAATCLLIGDTVRGRRTFNTQPLRTDPGFWSLQDVAMSGSWKAASERVRGFARVVGVVSDIVKNRENHPLTATELLVLELLADGKSAGDIAKDLDRSIYTIRAHTRAIIGKFNVRGRLAAVAYARKAGIIP